jgi:hypothetical protein
VNVGTACLGVAFLRRSAKCASLGLFLGGLLSSFSCVVEAVSLSLLLTLYFLLERSVRRHVVRRR